MLSAIIMPCVNSVFERLTAPSRPASLLGALNPRWGGRFADGRGRGVIESVQGTGIAAATIRIKPPIGWPTPAAGQFMTVGVEMDGVLETRCFTISGSSAASPSDAGKASATRGSYCEITVQSSPAGVVSQHLVNSSRAGDVVLLGSPSGDFTLESVGTGSMLFLTAGSGITPAVAMLRSLAHRASVSASGAPAQLGGGQATLIHHARSADSVLFRQELQRLESQHDWLDLHILHTRGSDGEVLANTRLEAELIAQRCGDWQSRTTFLCGPESHMAAAVEIWDQVGALGRLRSESFRASDRRPAVDRSAEGTVKFARSGVSAPVTNTSILEAAEAAGLSPASGCRMGICHTCVTRVTDGNAIDLRDGSIRSAGDTVQICVSCPVDEVTLDL